MLALARGRGIKDPTPPPPPPKKKLPTKKTEKKEKKSTAGRKRKDPEVSGGGGDNLSTELARLKAENASLIKSIGQYKRSRVYNLPGGRQLFKWVQKCSSFEEIMALAKGNQRAYVVDMLKKILGAAVIRLCQTGGDSSTFCLTLTLTGFERTETFIHNEDTTDNPFEIGQEAQQQLEPYAVRLVCTSGDIRITDSGAMAGRSRYVYDYSAAEDFAHSFPDVARTEFRFHTDALLQIVLAHAVDFIPNSVRTAYLDALGPDTYLAHCIRTCGCHAADK